MHAVADAPKAQLGRPADGARAFSVNQLLADHASNELAKVVARMISSIGRSVESATE